METFLHVARALALVLVMACTTVACGDLTAPAGSGPTPGAGSKSPVAGTAEPFEDESAPALDPSAASEPAEVPEFLPGSDPSLAADPSAASEAVPVGDLPGWRQVFVEDFTSGAVGLGGFPGPFYNARWSENYVDGTPDTAAQQQPKDARTSGYYPSKVLSVHDGFLDMYLHSENGVAMGAAPSPKFDPASKRPFNSLVYGRYSVRFKADVLAGFKLAWLLWPDSKQWPEDGEIDFPEGDLSRVIYAAVHGIEDGQHRNEVFRPNMPYGDWHTATTEWRADGVEFFLDGKSLGISTRFTPTKPMHYILQTEACSPTCPLPETNGHVLVDWVAIWAKT